MLRAVSKSTGHLKPVALMLYHGFDTSPVASANPRLVGLLNEPGIFENRNHRTQMSFKLLPPAN